MNSQNLVLPKADKEDLVVRMKELKNLDFQDVHYQFSKDRHLKDLMLDEIAVGIKDTQQRKSLDFYPLEDLNQ